MRKSGFTLVELIIVVAIIVILAVIATSIFNSTGVFQKARDSQRKKDLGRIKVAFEEYYNDNGCYPDKVMVDKLNLSTNCGKNVFSPWLNDWPCDPNKKPYLVMIDDSEFNKCSKWYKVLVLLENTKDESIPKGWDYLSSYMLLGGATKGIVNYGVSSSNVNWYEQITDPACAIYGGCYYRPDPIDQPNVCNSAGTGCVGPNCFLGICKTSCQVACCGVGCK